MASQMYWYPNVFSLVVHNDEGNVSVLLGNGDGTFQPAVSYLTQGTDTFSIAVADLNGDGKPDMVAACSCTGDCERDPGIASVLLGNGDGTFRPAVLYQFVSSAGPQFVAIADLNRDGKPDLLAADNLGVEVLLGNGDGTFGTPQAYSSGGEAVSVTVGDVNGDGKLDALVANGSSMAVLLGNGDGTFQPPMMPIFTGIVTAVAVGDVNGDGKPDLILTPNGGVTVLLGNGDGTFQAAANNDDFAGEPLGVAVADVNGDGKPDVAIAIDGPSNVGVLLNNSGAPPTTTSLASSANPARIREVVTYTATVTAKSGRAVSGVVRFWELGIVEVLQATVAVAGNQATYSASYKKAGSHIITATYSGDLKNANSASDALTEQIIKAHSSKTTLTTSGSPSFPGQTVTFTATVTSTGGAIPDGEFVTFSDAKTTLGSVALAGGTAAYATSSLSLKKHTIKATYAGDAAFNPSVGSVLQVVETWPTTTILTSTPNPSAHGQAVTFTATVTSGGPAPTGTIKFLDGAKSLGSATLSGGGAKLIKSTLAVGTHPITAAYLGDAASGKSTSAVVNQVVH